MTLVGLLCRKLHYLYFLVHRFTIRLFSTFHLNQNEHIAINSLHIKRAEMKIDRSTYYVMLFLSDAVTCLRRFPTKAKMLKSNFSIATLLMFYAIWYCSFAVVVNQNV